MAYSVETSPGFDSRFEQAVQYRLTYYGANSARSLITAQEHIVELLSTTPFMGALVDQDDAVLRTDALRWVKVDAYIAVYQPHVDTQKVIMADLFYSREDWRGKVRSPQ